MLEERKDKCVYLHKDSDGVVRYVGHGNSRRPFEFTSSKRSKTWNLIFSFKCPPIVEIVKTELSFTEAVDLENHLIEEYKNTALNSRKSNTTRKILLSDIEEYFHYDETSPSGLRWKKVSKFQNKSEGDVAGYILDKKSSNKKYWRVHFLGSSYAVHRLIWILKTKNDSIEHILIDHIDGDGLNNNFSNLRCSDYHTNCHNKKLQLNNKCGIKNVVSVGNTYRVSITRNGILYRGSFKSVTEAVDARDFAIANFDSFIIDPELYGMHRVINRKDLNE